MIEKNVFWRNKWQHFCDTGEVYTDENYFFDMHDLLLVSRLITNKILFLTVGVSGSGKTSFSTFLEAEYDCEVYEQDVMLIENVGFYEQMRIYNHMLTHSKLLCVDATNITKEMRSRFINPARRQGFTIIAVLFDEDQQNIIERNIKRGNMNIEKILDDIERLEVPQPLLEVDITITNGEFRSVFMPTFMNTNSSTYDLRKGWII